MKKALCLLLTIILSLCAVPPVLAEGDSSWEEFDFEPDIANGMDNTSSEWMATTSNRALLTTLLVLEASFDKVLKDNDILGMLANSSYITSTSIIGIYITGYTDDYIYLLSYSPILETAHCARTRNEFNSFLIETSLKSALEEAYSDGIVYKNDKQDILEWLEVILKAIKN